ncbi:MAG: glycosyltransferase family 39 protein [Planctomycetaceae bacterium]
MLRATAPPKHPLSAIELSLSSSAARTSTVENGPVHDRRPFVILAVALGVRVAYFLAYLNSPFRGVHLADQSYYRNWGMGIAEGKWLGSGVFEQGPLYAYRLGIAYWLGASDEIILALQLLAGLVVSILIYLSAKRLFDRNVALTAGLVSATYGPFVHAECMLMKSFLSPLLTMIALYAALRAAERQQRLWTAIAGAAVGLACLVTENHILLLLPIAVWLWTTGPATNAKEGSSAWNRVFSILLLGGSCAAMILPATVRNFAVSGEWVAVTAGGGEVFYMAWGPSATGNYEPPPFVRSNPYLEHEDFRREARRRAGRDLTSGESSRYWFREGLNSILADPGRAVGLAAKKFIGLFNNFEVPDSEHYQVAREWIPLLYVLPSFGWLVGVGFVGLAVSFSDLRRYQLPLGMLGVHVLSIILTYNFGRFRLGMTAIFILFAAAGLLWLLRAWRAPGAVPRRMPATIAAVILTAVAWLPSPSVSRDALASETEKHREALKFLSQMRAESERLAKQVAEKPDDAALRVELGETELKLGRFYEALAQLTESVRLDGTNLRARCRLADARQACGDYETALAELEAVFAANPASAELEQSLGTFVSRGANLADKDWMRLAVMLESISDDAAKANRFEVAVRTAKSAFLAAQEAHDLKAANRLEQKFKAYERGLKVE